MNFIQQFKILKWTLIFILFFNLIFIFTGTGFMIFFYKANKTSMKQNSLLIEENLTLAKTLKELESTRKTGEFSKELWQLLVKLESSPTKPDSLSWTDKILKVGTLEFAKKMDSTISKEELLDWQAQNYEKIGMSYQIMDRLKGILLFSLFISFVLGVMLPLIVFAIFVKKIMSIQDQIKSIAKEFVLEWKSSLLLKNGNRFNNPEFWLKTLLILTKAGSRIIRHPLLVFIYDLCESLLLEFNHNPKSDIEVEHP